MPLGRPRSFIRAAATTRESSQEALRQCANVRKPCELRLGAGVFQTDVLLAEGFNGSITGRGQGRTIASGAAGASVRRAAVRRRADARSTVSGAAALLPATARVSISKLTVEVPEGTTVAPYRDSGFIPDVGIIENALMAAIAVAGDREARLALRDVTIAGADVEDAPNFSTLTSAVQFGGEVRAAEDNDRTRKLQRGRFSARNVEVRRSGTGIWLRDAENSSAIIAGNELDVRTYGILAIDVGSSTVDILLNDIHAGLEGVLLAQEHSSVGRADRLYGGAEQDRRERRRHGAPADGVSYDGVGVYDWAETPESLNFNADIWANEVTLGRM